MKTTSFILTISILMFGSCVQRETATELKSKLNPENFKKEVAQKPTALYTLTNSNGMEVSITNFGGRIVSVMVPDKKGNMQDVVLGFDSISDYVHIPSDFGAAIGRYANRIKGGKMTVAGQEVQLPQNNFGHCLHGGPNGWQYRVYDVKQVTPSSLELALLSADGDENFPGNVAVKVHYTLTDKNAIDIRYEATTDKPTVINMTNHSYFNLSGNANQPITDHLLYVNADQYTPVDTTFIPLGEIVPVAGTPMDFTTLRCVGTDIRNFEFGQIKNGNGYDHNWVLNTAGDVTQVAARLVSPVTGITLDVYTDEPGIQVYSGNFLDGTVTGKNQIVYQQHAAICLETQHYPDSPNNPQWPAVTLNPGETYHSRCIFAFGVE